MSIKIKGLEKIKENVKKTFLNTLLEKLEKKESKQILKENDIQKLLERKHIMNIINVKDSLKQDIGIDNFFQIFEESDYDNNLNTTDQNKDDMSRLLFIEGNTNGKLDFNYLKSQNIYFNNDKIEFSGFKKQNDKFSNYYLEKENIEDINIYEGEISLQEENNEVMIIEIKINTGFELYYMKDLDNKTKKCYKNIKELYNMVGKQKKTKAKRNRG